MRLFSAAVAAAAFFSNTTAFVLPGRVPHDLTNGQRLARGLPLKAPSRHWDAAQRRSGPSITPEPEPTPSASASVSESVPIPSSSSIPDVEYTTYTGHIYIHRSDTGNSLGCIGTDLSKGLLIFDPDKANAATVTVKLVKGSTFGSRLDVTMVNPQVPGLDYLGFVRGQGNSDSDLKSGSTNYVTTTLVEKTAPGSPPTDVENYYSQTTGAETGSESALWSFNSVSNEIFPRWVNSDGSIPFYSYYLQSWASGVIAIVGDSSAFQRQYPAAIPIGFSFQPIEV